MAVCIAFIAGMFFGIFIVSLAAVSSRDQLERDMEEELKRRMDTGTKK